MPKSVLLRQNLYWGRGRGGRLKPIQTTWKCSIQKKILSFLLNPDKKPHQKLKQNILIRLAPTSLVASNCLSNRVWQEKKVICSLQELTACNSLYLCSRLSNPSFIGTMIDASLLFSFVEPRRTQCLLFISSTQCLSTQRKQCKVQTWVWQPLASKLNPIGIVLVNSRPGLKFKNSLGQIA